MKSDRLDKINNVVNSSSGPAASIPAWIITCMAGVGLVGTVSCASNKKEETKTVESRTITATGVYGAPMRVKSVTITERPAVKIIKVTPVVDKEEEAPMK